MFHFSLPCCLECGVMCSNGNIFSVGLCNTFLEIALPIVNITISVFDTIRPNQNVYLKNAWKKEAVCITADSLGVEKSLPIGY